MTETDWDARRHALDASTWQIAVACIAGLTLTLARLYALISIMLGDGPTTWTHIGQFVVKVCVGAALTYGIFRRSLAAAITFFGISVIGLGLAVFLGDQVLSVSGRIMLALIAVAFGLGVRGTWTLRRNKRPT